MTVKPWMTKLLAVVLLAVNYYLQHAVIPKGATILGMSVAGVAADLAMAIGMLGISGPQLWRWAATMMGNGPGQAPPPQT